MYAHLLDIRGTRAMEWTRLPTQCEGKPRAFLIGDSSGSFTSLIVWESYGWAPPAKIGTFELPSGMNECRDFLKEVKKMEQR